MSTDLMRAFDRIGEVADSARLPTLEAIRRRGRQRRHRTVGATLAASLAVMAIAATSAVALSSARHDPAGVPEMPPPIAFVPLDPAAKPLVGLDRPIESATTQLDDTYLYSMVKFVGDDVEHLAVVDLATGRLLWQPVAARYAASVQRHADTILLSMFPGEVAGANAPWPVAVLDLGSGRELWRLPELDNAFHEVFGNTVVIVWRDHDRAEGRELRTGRLLWTINEPIVWSYRLRTSREFIGPALGATPPADDRMLLQLENGGLKIVEGRSGNVVAQRGGVPLPSDSARYGHGPVVDGRLYLNDDRGVHEFDVFRDSPPRTVFERAKPPKDISAVTVCGLQLLCVIEDSADGQGMEVIAVDVGLGRQLWRRPSGDGVVAFGSGAAIVVHDRSSVGAIYSLTGRSLLPSPRRETYAYWIDEGNLLFVRSEPGRGPIVSGFSLANGRETPLGELPGRSACAWNRHLLGCAKSDGIYVWRYVQ